VLILLSLILIFCTFDSTDTDLWTGETDGGVQCKGQVRLDKNYNQGYHYISSLYFAYATLTTVGYGDIKAKTYGERSVALAALVIGSAVFAGIVGTMGQLMETMDENEEKKLKKIKQLQQFIKSHHFPERTRTRLRDFYDLHFQFTKKELGMLSELPPALRNDCMQHIYEDQLEKIPFLKGTNAVTKNAFLSRLVKKPAAERELFLLPPGAPPPPPPPPLPPAPPPPPPPPLLLFFFSFLT